MLLDHYCPEYDYNEVHAGRLPGTPAENYALVRRLDFSSSWIIRMLFFLRGLDASALSLDAMLAGDEFGMLQEDPPHEYVVGGLVSPRLKAVAITSTEHFLEFQEPEAMKLAWNFILKPGDGDTVVTTETRVLCLGSKMKRKFAVYWFFIRPFSGLVRLEMLRGLRRESRHRTTT